MSCVFYRELWRKEKESLEEMAEITKEGLLRKQQLIEEAKRGVQDKKVWLTLMTQIWFHY